MTRPLHVFLHEDLERGDFQTAQEVDERIAILIDEPTLFSGIKT